SPGAGEPRRDLPAARRRRRDRPRGRHHRDRGALQPRRLRCPGRRPAGRARGDQPDARRFRRRPGRGRRARRRHQHHRPCRLREHGGGGAVSAGTTRSASAAAGGPTRALAAGPTRAVSAAGTGWDRPGVRIAAGALLPLLILIAWQAVTATGVVPAYRLPGPSAVLAAGADLAQRGELGVHIAISIQRVLIGFAAGSAAGLAVAAVVGLSRAGDALLNPTLAALRAVPSLAWVPL